MSVYEKRRKPTTIITTPNSDVFYCTGFDDLRCTLVEEQFRDRSTSHRCERQGTNVHHRLLDPHRDGSLTSETGDVSTRPDPRVAQLLLEGERDG